MLKDMTELKIHVSDVHIVTSLGETPDNNANEIVNFDVMPTEANDTDGTSIIDEISFETDVSSVTQVECPICDEKFDAVI